MIIALIEGDTPRLVGYFDDTKHFKAVAKGSGPIRVAANCRAIS